MSRNPVGALDRYLNRRSRLTILVLAASVVGVVEAADYLTGFEVSLSLFYLAPVALAAWYAGVGAGVAIAAIACVGWYLADVAAGNHYSVAAIAIWNALVRLGIFLVTGLLLSALRESLRAQQILARTDSLTGLHGRRAFEERLAHDLTLARRHRTALSLAFMDLDGFKAVNDALGHAEGDRMLRIVGRVLLDSLREVDTAARIGGDEFAVIMPDTDAGGAHEVVSKVMRELSTALAELEDAVTLSAGVVTVADSAVTPERVVAAADELMYRVKRSGKGAAAFTVLDAPWDAAESHSPPSGHEQARTSEVTR